MTLLTLLKPTTGGGGMPITVTARHNTNAGQTSGQTRATNSSGPTADSLFFCFFGAENDNHTQVPAPQTPVGGGWTYTQRATSGVSTAYEWDGTTGFRLSQALYTAPIGEPLLNYTITVDMYSTTNLGYYSAICLDVTGHDTGGTPLYYTNGANISTASDSASGTVTLGATPAVGDMVVVSFYSGADSGGTMSAATVGGQSMTAITVQTTSGFSLQGAWSREWTGAESNLTITCPDLGQQAGSYTAIAVVIPAAAGGGSSHTETPNENLGLTDTASVSFVLDRTAADTLNLTDSTALARGVGISSSDNLGLTDTPTLDRVQAPSDALGLTDAAALARGAVQAAADNLGLTDATTQALGQAQSDPLGLTDSVSIQASGAGTVSPSDSEALTDSLALTRSQSTSDNEALTDTVAVEPTRVRTSSDNLGLTDQIALVITRDLGDTLTLSDTADLTATFVRVLDETASLTDAAVVALIGPTTGTVIRPDTGTTSRPGSGLTPRPFTGTTVRPG